MSRPCRWPDGGCGEPVDFYPTGRLKADGKPKFQVVDPKPIGKGIVLRLPEHVHGYQGPDELVAVVADIYVDHHATCAAWARLTETARAAKAVRT